MSVILKLFASLRKYRTVINGTGGDSVVEIPGSLTVGQLLHSRGIPLEEAQVVLVNGNRAGHDYKLQDGDTVSVFPLIGGG